MVEVSAIEIKAAGGELLGATGNGIYDPYLGLVLVARVLTSIDQRRRPIAGDQPVAAKFMPPSGIVVQPRMRPYRAPEPGPKHFVKLKMDDLTLQPIPTFKPEQDVPVKIAQNISQPEADAEPEDSQPRSMSVGVKQLLRLRLG